MVEHAMMKTSKGEEDNKLNRSLPSNTPTSRDPPPSALPLDLFSPLPPSSRQKQHPPADPSYATSSSGQITPPASASPPRRESIFAPPEPVTPRKAPPIPGSAPCTPIREDDPSPTYPRQRRESSALEQYFPERPSFSTSYSPPASPSRRVVSWPVPPTRRVTFDSADAPTWPLQAVPPPTNRSSNPQFRRSPSPSAASFPSSSTDSTPPSADLSLPRIELSRTTIDTVHPGSSVPLALRAFNFLPSPLRPCPVTIVFTGTSRIAPSPSSSSSTPAAERGGSEHHLFRLEAQVVLDGPLWTGSITVPTSCRCETCGAVLEAIPWTFVHEDGESGTRFETVSQVEAKAGELRTVLEVEVLPRPKLPASETWNLVGAEEHEKVAQSGIEGLTVEAAQLHYMLDSAFLSPDATADCPLHLEAVFRFRRSSSFSSTDLAALLSLLSPSPTTFTLESVLSSLDGSTSQPIGGSWTTSPDPNDFRLEVDLAEEQLTVTIRLPLVPKAVVFASIASCAGFAVGFHLHLNIGPSPRASDSSFDSLRISTPFLPPPAPSALPAQDPAATPPVPSPFAPTSAVDPSELEAAQLRGMDDEVEGNVRKGRWRKRFKRFGRRVKMGFLQF